MNHKGHDNMLKLCNAGIYILCMYILTCANSADRERGAKLDPVDRNTQLGISEPSEASDTLDSLQIHASINEYRDGGRAVTIRLSILNASDVEVEIATWGAANHNVGLSAFIEIDSMCVESAAGESMLVRDSSGAVLRDEISSHGNELRASIGRPQRLAAGDSASFEYRSSFYQYGVETGVYELEIFYKTIVYEIQHEKTIAERLLCTSDRLALRISPYGVTP